MISDLAISQNLLKGCLLTMLKVKFFNLRSCLLFHIENSVKLEKNQLLENEKDSTPIFMETSPAAVAKPENSEDFLPLKLLAKSRAVEI